MYLSAAGAHAQSQRVEVLSNNVANAQTPGFKRELAVLSARHAEAITRGEDYAGSRSINDLGGGVYLSETMTDFAQGTLKPTERPTDLAIDGEGFFVVEQEGKQFLTRAGNFSMSPSGALLASNGANVMASDGSRLTVDPSIPWEVQANGEIVQAGEARQVAVVKPRSLGDLAKAGENLFLPLAPTMPVEPEQRRVISGYVELSGANPIREMTQLIEASRAYEANVRMIQNHDQTLGALVGRLLRA
jgi:flagellar basal-body rod protein FlgF/flagellar basal-body rod protein FlgG